MQQDVLEVLTIMVEFSRYAHFVMWKMAHGSLENTIFNDSKKAVRQFLMDLLHQVVSPKKYRPDPHYTKVREGAGLWRVYNVHYRRAILEQKIVLYETVLFNNIWMNISRRLKKIFMLVPDEEGNVMDKTTARRHVAQVLSGETEDARLGVKFEANWKNRNLLRFVPMMFNIQQQLFHSSNRSFVVIPQFKMKSHHIMYTNTGLHQFWQRYKDRLDLPSLKQTAFTTEPTKRTGSKFAISNDMKSQEVLLFAC